MNPPYYVTLTGSRNNAGDFLIRHRGHELLRRLRPDRTVVDRNAWEPFDEERLEEVNGAAALILLGGPALRRDMYPTVYPLLPDLDRIEVPIAVMGAGWHATPGTWEDSREYHFTPDTHRLLTRIAEDGAGLGVRDYRSLNALDHAGIEGGVMTGCPALYAERQLQTNFQGLPPEGISELVFSVGVNFIRSEGLERQLKETIVGLRGHFPDANLTVAFHHSLSPERLQKAYGGGQDLSTRKHRGIVHWLETEAIAYRDISGGVDKLIDLYTRADFHVGYRVHAHIFMSSLRKPSVLLTEDGRGRGLKDVLGGIILDTYAARVIPAKERLLARFGRKITERVVAFSGIADDVASIVRYEQEHGYPRFAQPSRRIKRHYPIMEGYLRGLP